MRFAGFALDVSGERAEPVAADERSRLRTLKSVVFQARLTDAPGPMPFQFTSSAGDLTGELSVCAGPAVRGVGDGFVAASGPRRVAVAPGGAGGGNGLRRPRRTGGARQDDRR